MNQKIIIANWKMNLGLKESMSFVKNLKSAQNKVIIAAPFTFLPILKKELVKKSIMLAGQNVSAFKAGAYTGEISAKMLKDAGSRYCLVGHSERRFYFQETDRMINQKIKRLLEYKICPVFCIGENAQERGRGLTMQIIKKQLTLGLKYIKGPARILIAYEPVWAISTFQKGKVKHSARPEDIEEAHLFIKNILKKMYKNKADKIKILYGGTVSPQNAKGILGLKEVDGALVGGASLKFSSFNAIIKSV